MSVLFLPFVKLVGRGKLVFGGLNPSEFLAACRAEFHFAVDEGAAVSDKDGVIVNFAGEGVGVLVVAVVAGSAHEHLYCFYGVYITLLLFGWVESLLL